MNIDIPVTVGKLSSGDIVEVIVAEFGITQPAVSQHLRVLRDNGFANVRPDGTRRLYSIEARALRDVDVWLERFRSMCCGFRWTPERP